MHAYIHKCVPIRRKYRQCPEIKDERPRIDREFFSISQVSSFLDFRSNTVTVTKTWKSQSSTKRRPVIYTHTYMYMYCTHVYVQYVNLDIEIFEKEIDFTGMVGSERL